MITFASVLCTITSLWFPSLSMSGNPFSMPVMQTSAPLSMVAELGRWLSRQMFGYADGGLVKQMVVWLSRWWFG